MVAVAPVSKTTVPISVVVAADVLTLCVALALDPFRSTVPRAVISGTVCNHAAVLLRRLFAQWRRSYKIARMLTTLREPGGLRMYDFAERAGCRRQPAASAVRFDDGTVVPIKFASVKGMVRELNRRLRRRDCLSSAATDGDPESPQP
jgi:hypothetical protein